MTAFEQKHRSMLLTAIDAYITSNHRSKAKQPRFAEVIDRDLALLRECRSIVTDWAVQAPAPEKPEAPGKK